MYRRRRKGSDARMFKQLIMNGRKSDA